MLCDEKYVLSNVVISGNPCRVFRHFEKTSLKFRPSPPPTPTYGVLELRLM